MQTGFLRVTLGLLRYALLKINLANLKDLEEVKQAFKEFVTDNFDKMLEYSTTKTVDIRNRKKIYFEDLLRLFENLLTDSDKYIKMLSTNTLTNDYASRLNLDKDEINREKWT